MTDNAANKAIRTLELEIFAVSGGAGGFTAAIITPRGSPQPKLARAPQRRATHTAKPALAHAGRAGKTL